MIVRNENSIKYVCFMYQQPYTLLAIENANVKGVSYSQKKEVDEENKRVIYTFCLAKEGRQEDKPEVKVSISLCPADKNELVIFLTTPNFVLPIESVPANMPSLWIPETDILLKAKKHLLQLHNEARDTYGDGSDLLYDTVIDNIAQSYANYITLNDDFSHTSVDGVTVDMRFTMGGYQKNFSYTDAGENLALAPYTGDLINDVTVLFRLWKESEGHWANLLDSNWVYVGFGIAVDLTKNIVYGVANFMYGGNRQRVPYVVEDYYFTHYLGYTPNYILKYESKDINSDHSLNIANILPSYNLKFFYQTPALPALKFLGFYKNYQSSLIHTIINYTAGQLGDIGENKEDALQLAGKDYSYEVVNWNSFNSFSPGGYLFCAFSLDNYKGEYPQTFFESLNAVVYMGTFLETFGLTGGRIIKRYVDIDGNYVYDIVVGNKVVKNVRSAGGFVYSYDDYVVLSKTSKSFDANSGFDFIGKGRDNSPDGFRGYNLYPQFSNKPVYNLSSDNVNTIDTVRDDYYILPIDRLDLPF